MRVSACVRAGRDGRNDGRVKNIEFELTALTALTTLACGMRAFAVG